MLGWVGILIYVIAYDVRATLKGSQTLSGAFYEAFGHPVHKWGVIAVWSILTLHLFHLMPDKYDPIRRLGAEIWSVSKKNISLAEVVNLSQYRKSKPTPKTASSSSNTN